MDPLESELLCGLSISSVHKIVVRFFVVFVLYNIFGGIFVSSFIITVG